MKKGGRILHPYIEKTRQQIYFSYHSEPYDFPSHFHPNLELIFCFSGLQTVMVGEEIITLETGDACIIFPNIVHEYRATPGAPDTESLSVICNATLLTNVFPDILSKYPVTPYIPTSLLPSSTAITFRQLLNAENTMKLIGYTYLILSDFLERIELTASSSDLDLPAVITSYIDANFREPLTLDIIAKKFGYHPTYIANLFCYRLKIPFRTYLGAVRCDYAAKQIRSTQKSLTEIAFESGFGSLNTFCRVFKKNFSMTPSQYRKGVK